MREIRRNGGDQVTHQPTIKVDPLSNDLRTDRAPVRKGLRVTKDHANLLKDVHGGRIDPFDHLVIEDLAWRQGVVQTGQHCNIVLAAARAPCGAPSAPPPICRDLCLHGCAPVYPSDIDFDLSNRLRAAGKDVAVRDVVFRNAAVLDHVDLALGLADLACSADPEGAARGDVQPRTTGDG